MGIMNQGVSQCITPVKQPAKNACNPLNTGVTELFPIKKTSYPIGHPINKKFVFSLFSKHPSLKTALRAEWLLVAKQKDYVAANFRLGRLHERLTLGKTGLFMDSPDHVVKSYCEAKAKKTEKDVTDFAMRGLKEMLFDYVVKVVNDAGLDFPLDDINDYEHEEMIAAIKRVCCAKWWRRQVRKIMAREVEAVARDLRLVHSKAGIYCSNYTANRHAEQRSRNRDLLNSLEAVNEDEYCKTLAELSDLSVSNPENRRNELMVRIRGFEELAIQAGHTGLFLTLTCPSKYHSFLKAGYPNPKYSGATPRDAQAYLCEVWARIRSEWARNEIFPYGFRVVEPHHDGTPHWHAMLFIEPDKKIKALEIFREHALREDGDEHGAQKYRAKIVQIDPKMGTAAGYIAKYISKNIDGHGVEKDLYGKDAKSSARRIEAWASTWGIRQFQQIGGASVTVWRELRRLTAEDMKDLDFTCEQIEGVRKAADDADWAAFTMLMGGVQVKREDQLLRPMYLPNEELNSYGEMCQALKGLFNSAGSVVTRVHEWFIQKAGTEAKKHDKHQFTLEKSMTHKRMEASSAIGAPVECAGSFFRGLGFRSTWTCVTNCTEGIPPGRLCTN